MTDFEEVLKKWAARRLPDAVKIESVEIYADPGNNRDDSYYEPPATYIVISGRDKEGRFTSDRVAPDLLTIVRDLSAISREREAWINAPF